jgi:hypothetical protein
MQANLPDQGLIAFDTAQMACHDGMPSGFAATTPIGCRTAQVRGGGVVTMKMLATAGAGLITCLAIGGSASFGQALSQPGPAVMHRLTQDQYRNSIRAMFGPSVAVGGQFAPDPRSHGLIAVGAAEATITGSMLEQYDRIANGVAAQIVDARHRDQLIPCKPSDAAKRDDACARKFLDEVGHLLFRRPLSPVELAGYGGMAGQAAMVLGDFYGGLGIALAEMLEAPQFLFWTEQAEPDGHGGYRLTPASMASRLSFLLWGTAPDLPLLAAAEQGKLRTAKGLEREVDRMLASPLLENGVRAFFGDMFGFDAFDVVAKDVQLYPGFTREAAVQAKEQTLRTVVDHLLKRDGDYRELFKTRETFLTPLLASLYRVRLDRVKNTVGEWTAYEFPAEMPQAGVLTQLSFLALYSHPGATSPTERGKAVREVVLCQKVPAPPANVDFSKFETAETAGKPTTIRDRLNTHATNPSCAGCHRLTDPIGFALENYDTAGGYRRTENGLTIDTGGKLGATTFLDANGLGEALYEDKQTTRCVVDRVFSYATGRTPSAGESAWLTRDVEPEFAKGGYRMRALLRRLALDPAFYAVSAEP